MTLTPTALALQKATEGLTFQSESDEPWTAFSWAGLSGVPTAEKVRQAGKHKTSAAVAEQSVEEFFNPLVQLQDWFGDAEKATAARYQGLLDVVKSSLQNSKVFRVGNRKVTIYLVGGASEGGWAGLKTTSVET